MASWIDRAATATAPAGEDAAGPASAPLETRRGLRLLGTRVEATTYPRVLGQIEGWLAEDEPRGRSVCLANVHSLMTAYDDPAFRAVLDGADLVAPDGMPLVWALRLLGARAVARVYGPDLTLLLCERAAASGTPIGFYGSTPAVLARLVERLTGRYPGLAVVYRHSPPFRPLSEAEREAERAAMHESGARIIFVGLGCPRQERWMAERRGELACVLLGVGAAFDFLSGNKPMAPDWIQALGLEWLFRLVCEPRRLWRRYLLNNPRFLVLFALQLLLPLPRRSIETKRGDGAGAERETGTAFDGGRGIG